MSAEYLSASTINTEVANQSPNPLIRQLSDLTPHTTASIETIIQMNYIDSDNTQVAQLLREKPQIYSMARAAFVGVDLDATLKSDRAVEIFTEFSRAWEDPEHSDIDLEELYSISHSLRGIDPAEKMLTYLAFKRDPAVIQWYKSDIDLHAERDFRPEEIKQIFRYWVNNDSFEEISMLLASPNKNLMLKAFSSRYDLHETVERLSAGQLPSSYLINHPEAIVVIAQYNRLLKANGEVTWDQKILLFQRYLDLAGLSGVEDFEINQFIAQHMGNAGENGIPTINTQVQNRLDIKDDDPGLVNQVRTVLKAQQLARVGKGETDTMTKRQRKLERMQVRRKHDPRQPLYHLEVSMGAEMEHPMAHGFSEYQLAVLDLIGFKRGIGGGKDEEFAPGPFYDPATMNLVYLMYFQAGFMDYYTEYGQGEHLNTGVKYRDGLDLFYRWNQGTAWSSDLTLPGMPRNSIDEAHVLMIKSNENGHGKYRESKELAFVRSAKGFASTNKYGASALSGLKAYQAALEQTVPVHHRYRLETSLTERIKIDGLLSPEEIESSNITIDQKRLALIWVKAMEKLTDGYKQAGFANVLNLRVPRRDFNNFRDHIAEVFPNKIARSTVNPAKVRVPDSRNPGSTDYLEIRFKSEKEGEPDEVYYNIPHFTRALYRQVHKQVVEVKAQALVECKQELARLKTMKRGRLRNIHMRRFFERFPCGFEGKPERLEMHKRFDFLCDQYEI